MPQTEQLRSFLTIAEMGNLTLAAGRLNKTQSAVSAQVKNLETELGVSLFSRSVRGMALNAYGERFLPKARAALQAIDALGEVFNDPLSGFVRVGIPDDLEDGRFERVLVGFAKEHPGVEVHVTSGCSQGFASAIERNDLDIAVASGPEYLDGIPLYEEKLVWAKAKADGPKLGGPIPLAVVDHGCWFARLPKEVLSDGGCPFRIVFSSSSFASICASVEAGLAISVLPERVLTDRMLSLDAKDALPQLPILRRTILRNAGSSEELLDAMTSALLNVAK